MISPEYITGFFDGEGCVNITVAGKNRQATLRVYIVNTNLEILQAIQRSYGGHIYEQKSVGRPTNWKRGWQLVLLNKVAINLLTNIEPLPL